MKVFWFDIETGGLDPEVNPILQLAYAVEIDGKRVESGELFCQGFPGCRIDSRALEINGLNLEQIQKAQSEREFYRALVRILNRYVQKYASTDKFIAGGYNVNFDMSFLRALWLRQKDVYFGSWFAFQYLDPANIVRFIQYAGAMPESARMKLVDLARTFEVARPDAHDALADIEMTIDVVHKMKELLSVSSPE